MWENSVNYKRLHWIQIKDISISVSPFIKKNTYIQSENTYAQRLLTNEPKT